MNVDDIEAQSALAYKQWLLSALIEDPLILEHEAEQWRSDIDIVKGTTTYTSYIYYHQYYYYYYYLYKLLYLKMVTRYNMHHLHLEVIRKLLYKLLILPLQL